MLIVALAFVALVVVRVAAARRAQLAPRWPALAAAAVAVVLALRGDLSLAAGLAALAIALWFVWPSVLGGVSNARPLTPSDVESRAVLGVGPSASEADIRGAYRRKMAQAHPDQGGAHAEAARLTAARDLLLRKPKA